jgi:hypothetical protein
MPTNLALLPLPADMRALIDQACRRAGVPVRSPLLDGMEPQTAAIASNVIPFPIKRAARG